MNTTIAWEPRRALVRPVVVPQRAKKSRLAWRLAAVIALVAIASLSVFAILTLRLADRDVSQLSTESEVTLGQAVASALAVSYNSTKSWTSAEVSAVTTLANDRGVAIVIRDTAKKVVLSSDPPSTAKAAGPAYSFPIDIGSQQVGTVQIWSAQSGFGYVANMRHSLALAVAWSALGAALLAIGAGILVARRRTAPLVQLTEAARAVASGGQGIRVKLGSGSNEFSDLSLAFNAMAGSLERHEKLRRQLVADVAHELRTPVAVLQAWLEAMVDGVVELDSLAVSSLLDETLRLSRIVRDLQVLSSSDVDALELDFQLLSLDDVASEAATVIKAKVDKAKLTLSTDLEPVVVNGDRTRLYQVISNLLTNSIKFTPAGGQIALTVTHVGRTARIVVDDTGIGIPADELPHVFERFWRGQQSVRRGGSGIGLAVVAELIQAHGGDVTVTSQGRKGSRFVVSLPAA